MNITDIRIVYDKMLTDYENDCANGLQTKIAGDPVPVEKLLNYQPMFSDEDIELIKEHEASDVDTCIKFIVFYSYYILTEPDREQIIDFIRDDYHTDLNDDLEFLDRMNKYMNDIV